MATSPHDAANLFLQQYIDFCQSPLRDKEDIEADLARLAALPMVKLLAFADDTKIPNTLMIGLRPLIIQDPKTQKDHFIGNFIVYITRYREYPVWQSDFELVNLNPQYVNGYPEHFHPHMTIRDHAHLGNVAYICIQEGQYNIFQYIRRGQLDLAMILIINLLHSLGPNAPFKPINEWPLARKRKERPWFFPKKLAR